MSDKWAKVIRMSDLTPGLPPKHTETDSWPLCKPALLGNKHCEFYLTEIRPGGVAEMDVHDAEEHIYFVISGRLKMTVEDEEYEIGANDTIFMSAGARHAVEVIGRETARFLVIFAPARPTSF